MRKGGKREEGVREEGVREEGVREEGGRKEGERRVRKWRKGDRGRGRGTAAHYPNPVQNVLSLKYIS